MKKKYELTNESINHCGKTLYRVRALRDFSNVKYGDIGGFIESESNLSHEENSWISENARVFGNARVGGNAHVFGYAFIYENAQVNGNARVFGNTRVNGNAVIFGDAFISENARVGGNAQVFGNAWISDDARVLGDALIFGNARVNGNAIIKSTNDWIVIGPIGPRNDMITFMMSNSGNICVNCGCFYGELNQFMLSIEKNHGYNEHVKDYRMAIEMAKFRMGKS